MSATELTKKMLDNERDETRETVDSAIVHTESTSLSRKLFEHIAATGNPAPVPGWKREFCHDDHGAMRLQTECCGEAAARAGGMALQFGWPRLTFQTAKCGDGRLCVRAVCLSIFRSDVSAGAFRAAVASALILEPTYRKVIIRLYRQMPSGMMRSYALSELGKEGCRLLQDPGEQYGLARSKQRLDASYGDIFEAFVVKGGNLMASVTASEEAIRNTLPLAPALFRESTLASLL